MSVIRKKPYVESVIGSLTEAQKTSLVSLLNGGTNSGTKTLVEAVVLENGCYAINLELRSGDIKTGLFIKSSTHCCFIAYHKYQDVLLYEIDTTNKNCKKVNEYCDINELRRILTTGSGGGEPDAYLKTVAKDTANKVITITDQDGTATQFNYSDGSDQYKIYQFIDTTEHQADFVTISGIKVPKLSFNVAYEIWENAVYNKNFKSALKIVKTNSPSATTDGDFWLLNNIALGEEEAVDILYFSLKNVGIISYTIDRNGGAQEVTNISFKKFGEGGTGGGQEFVNTLPIPTEADEGVIYTLYQQGRTFPSANWPFTDFTHYYKVNPLLSGMVDVTIEYIEAHGSYKLTLDITGIGEQSLEIPCIYFTISAVNQLLSTLPEPLPVDLFIDCDDDDPDRVIYGTQLVGETDTTKWPLFMADGPFDSTNIPTTYVKVGEGETYTTDVENNTISIGGTDYTLSTEKFDLVDFFQIAGEPDALLRCTTATDPDRVIVITGSKKVFEENSFIPLQVIYDPNYTSINGSYALNGEQLIEITQEIKQELTNVKNKDSENAISCKAVYNYVNSKLNDIKYATIATEGFITVDGVQVPKLINRTLTEIVDTVAQDTIMAISLMSGTEINVMPIIYVNSKDASNKILVINYKGYTVKYSLSSGDQGDDATTEIISEAVTPTGLSNVLEGSSDITVDLNSTDSKLQVKLDQDIKDFILPVEVPTAKVQHEVVGSDSKIIILQDVLDPDNHYEITFEVESTSVHFGANFVVFPENEAPCFTEGLVDVNGEHKTYIATMDTTGQVTITLLGVTLDPSSEDTKVYYRRHI